MGSNHWRHRIGKGSKLRREAQSYYWVMRPSLGANTRAAHGIMTIDRRVENNSLSRLKHLHEIFSLVHNTQLLGDRYAVHHVDHDVMIPTRASMKHAAFVHGFRRETLYLSSKIT